MATCSSYLTDLYIKRDRLVSQLATSADWIEIELRGGRRVRRTEAIKVLEFLRDEIAIQERRQQRPTRNRVRLRR